MHEPWRYDIPDPHQPKSPVVGWEYTSLGDGFWLIASTPITASGAAVTHKLMFDFPFKLISIWLEHTVAAGTLGTGALTWSFNVLPRANFKNNFPIVAYAASVASQFLEIFGDDYLFPAGEYCFIQNTTNTDILRLSLIIQARKIQ